jgi:histidine triad (HIT) family protein
LLKAIAMVSDCIFCKIIQGAIKSTIIAQNEYVIAIQDIMPKAPFHYLIMPKKHIISLATITEADQEYITQVMFMARDLAQNVPNKAFNLIANNGSEAGQSVFHLHFHFLAGKDLYKNGLTL